MRASAVSTAQAFRAVFGIVAAGALHALAGAGRGVTGRWPRTLIRASPQGAQAAHHRDLELAPDRLEPDRVRFSVSAACGTFASDDFGPW